MIILPLLGTRRWLNIKMPDMAAGNLLWPQVNNAGALPSVNERIDTIPHEMIWENGCARRETGKLTDSLRDSGSTNPLRELPLMMYK